MRPLNVSLQRYRLFVPGYHGSLLFFHHYIYGFQFTTVHFRLLILLEFPFPFSTCSTSVFPGGFHLVGAAGAGGGGESGGVEGLWEEYLRGRRLRVNKDRK